MSSISINVYMNRVDNIINKYNHTYHDTIKMKPVDINSSTYINFDKIMKKMVLHLRLVAM